MWEKTDYQMLENLVSKLSDIKTSLDNIEEALKARVPAEKKSTKKE